MKVFLLGLDGFTLSILESYIEAGLLPNFRKIIDEGACGKLRSTIPFTTGPGWTSLTTGKNPGKHGIYDFRERSGYETKFITKNASSAAEPMWNVLSRNGRKVMVANIPFTYPPDEVNGMMLSGFMTPAVSTSKDVDFTYPKKLKEDIFKMIPDYQISVRLEKLMFYGDKEGLLREVLKVTEQGRTIMNIFFDKDSWDLFFICFVGTDRLQHFMWDEIVSIDSKCVQYYQLLDDILGDMLKRVDDETALFVVSDHGFGPAKKGFHINCFFRDLGLLHTRRELKRRLTHTISKDIAMTGFGRKLWMLLKRFIPLGLVRYMKKVILKKAASAKEIDWKKTKVFSLMTGGAVSLNVEGREPEGIVRKAEYDKICKMVEEELMGVKDPETGEKVVEAVYRGDQLYSSLGKSDCGRPDLVVVVKDGYSVRQEIVEETFSKNEFGSLRITGDHKRDGVFAAYGGNVNNVRIDADIYDIMPTVLYLLGVAIPEDVDGRVLTEIIDSGFTAENKVRFEKSRTASAGYKASLGTKEQEDIQRQLKSLGYAD